MNEIELITKALKCLPHSIRDEYMGEAWEYLQGLTGSDTEKLLKLRRWLENKSRRETKPQMASLPATLEQPYEGYEEVEVADTLKHLSKEDAALISLLIAGYTYREIANRRKVSASTVSRKVKALRDTKVLTEAQRPTVRE